LNFSEHARLSAERILEVGVEVDRLLVCLERRKIARNLLPHPAEACPPPGVVGGILQRRAERDVRMVELSHPDEEFAAEIECDGRLASFGELRQVFLKIGEGGFVFAEIIESLAECLGEPWVFELRIPDLRDFFGFLVLLERVETPGVAYVRIEVLGVFLSISGAIRATSLCLPSWLMRRMSEPVIPEGTLTAANAVWADTRTAAIHSSAPNTTIRATSDDLCIMM